MSPDKTWKKERIAAGDFNADGRDDIAAVAADGALHLYPRKADGTFDTARSMWPDKSWTTNRPVLGGDFRSPMVSKRFAECAHFSHNFSQVVQPFPSVTGLVM